MMSSGIISALSCQAVRCALSYNLDSSHTCSCSCLQLRHACFVVPEALLVQDEEDEEVDEMAEAEDLEEAEEAANRRMDMTSKLAFASKHSPENSLAQRKPGYGHSL